MKNPEETEDFEKMSQSSWSGAINTFMRIFNLENPRVFVDRFFQVITQLEDNMFSSLFPKSYSSTDDKENLYYRSLEDYLALQVCVSGIRNSILNKDQFVEIIKNMGHDLNSTKLHMEFVVLLSHAVENLMKLMHYNDPKRPDIDIRDGFSFTSGSMFFQHIYYDFPKSS